MDTRTYIYDRLKSYPHTHNIILEITRIWKHDNGEFLKAGKIVLQFKGIKTKVLKPPKNNPIRKELSGPTRGNPPNSLT